MPRNAWLDRKAIQLLSKSIKYVSYKLFDKNLVLTNSIISIVMGVFGDFVTQNHFIKYGHRQCKVSLRDQLERNSCNDSYDVSSKSSSNTDTVCLQLKEKLLKFEKAAISKSTCPSCDEKFQDKYNYIRASHMAVAGWSTGMSSHLWYKHLDRLLGTQRTFRMVTLKVFLDQIIMSPVNLVIYFGTVALLEQSNINKFKEEVLEKGMRNIFLVECVVWPPAQYFSFAVLQYKYRILWDNIVSFGFDIYYPHVKYDVRLESELASVKSSKKQVKEDNNNGLMSIVNTGCNEE